MKAETVEEQEADGAYGVGDREVDKLVQELQESQQQQRAQTNSSIETISQPSEIYFSNSNERSIEHGRQR